MPTILLPDASPLPLLRELGACSDAQEWAKQFGTLRECWERCERPDWLLWILGNLGLRDDRSDRVFACRCVRKTPLADGRKVWDLLTDERSRNAVVVAERFAAGRATEEELAAATDAAMAAAMAAATDAATDAAMVAARDAARDAAIVAAMVAAMVAESAVARVAAMVAESAVARAAAMAAAAKAQAVILREVYGDPFALAQTTGATP